jgi:hypothetical protein
MTARNVNAAGLVCEMIGVIMLFLWAWPQPTFDREDHLTVGTSQHVAEISSQKRWHSARALVGLGFIFIGYGLQLCVVLIPRRFTLTPPPSKLTNVGRNSDPQKRISKIDPLNYCVVQVQTLFDDTPIAKATGFFYSGTVAGKASLWFVTNWHVLTGRNALTPEVILHDKLAIPNRIRFQVLSHIGPDGQTGEDHLNLHELFIRLYDSDNLAMWNQHPKKNEVDVAVVNVGQSLEGHLIRGINELCTEYDMAIEIGNDVLVLGYPLGFSHFANMPIWKRGSIASEPHAETADSMNRIMIDATTRKGMSGSPVIMRCKTHYLSEDGQVNVRTNSSRFIGVYASRPSPRREPTYDELEAGLSSHEIAYVFKSGCVQETIMHGVRGPKYGELP